MAAEFDIDLDKVRAFLKSKSERRQKAIDERFTKATDDFKSIVARIISEINPKRIYQWGSLLDRRSFSEISDIDIALEGLNGAEEFFKALGIAMDGSSVPVDVVEIEKLPPSVAERIKKRGKTHPLVLMDLDRFVEFLRAI